MSALPQPGRDIIRLPRPLPPEPEPVRGLPRSWWATFCYACRCLWSSDLRERTPYEADLLAQLDYLRLEVWRRDMTIYNEQLRCAQLEADVRLKDYEISKLTMLHEVDRLRVERDMAVVARDIARRLDGSSGLGAADKGQG